MTLEQYKARKAEIEASAKRAINDLKKEYAKANNPYKIGDIFTDHIGSIEITECVGAGQIGYIDEPCMVYNGYILTAKGERRKDAATRSAWQSNDIKNRK